MKSHASGLPLLQITSDEAMGCVSIFAMRQDIEKSSGPCKR